MGAREESSDVKYRFRLAGAEKEIDVDDDDTVADVKRKVREAFGIGSDLEVHLIAFPSEEERGP